MTPSDEASFIRNLSSAMRRSGDLYSLGKLWGAYEEEIAACSPEGQTELQGLRAAREKEMRG